MITTYNDNLKSSPSGIYTYTITENKIVTLTLDGLKRDLDLQIRLSGIDQILHSSTKANTKREALTTWLPAGSYEIIVKEPNRGDSETDTNPANFAYTLTIDDESFQAQSSFPNDPLFPYQWHLFNTAERSKDIESTPFAPTIPFDSFRPEADIKAPRAWKTRAKASDIIIAIIDNGIDINHPDLKENIWINPGEIAGDGKDNDNNGYKDDAHGWSFINESPNFTPDDEHGTHIAGIAAASGNNGEGITGVAWEAKIMALDVDSDGDKNTEEMEAEAIRYAVDNGAKVINISLGENLKESPDEYLKRESILKPAFQYAYDNDVFISIAAGNEGGTEEAQDESYWEEQGNLDKYALHTASFSKLFSNIATVVALDQYGRKTSYSSYGQRTTIGAPGGESDEKAETYYMDEYEFEWTYDHGILSTVPTGTGDAKFGGNYDYADGTSMAAPVIAGMAALIRAADTRISAPDTIAILRASADKNPALSPYINGGLSANLQEALSIAESWEGPQTLTSLEQSQESPVLNLGYLTNAQRIQGTLRVTREAALDPITGFYKTLDAKGTVKAGNGTLLSPGDKGYESAALAADNLVTSLDKVSIKNGGKITKNFELGSSSYLAPFAKVTGNTWFAFEEANWDGFAHFKLLSPNKFGLEDLAYGGDQDFNDHILHFEATAII